MTLLTFAMSLTVLVPVVGLGVDSAMLYITKERLNSAVQLAAAKGGDRAQRTFAANFPAGYLGVTSATLEAKSEGQYLATAEAPTYFMRAFRVPSVKITAVAERPAPKAPQSQ